MSNIRKGDKVVVISGSDNDPVWIVNGDKEVAQHNLDFDARSVCDRGITCRTNHSQ